MVIQLCVKKAAELELPLTKEEKETLIAMREFLVNSQDEEIAKRYGFTFRRWFGCTLKLIFLNV